jgi:hypothetical protein
MPIFFVALIALGVFLVMGLMLLYAAYAESKTAHAADRQKPSEVKPGSETHATIA